MVWIAQSKIQHIISPTCDTQLTSASLHPAPSITPPSPLPQCRLCFGYRWYDLIVIPDYLNMIGAALYIRSSLLYAETDDSETVQYVHRLEMAAASVELAAAFMWAAVWIMTYTRGIPNRGWTLDDPDIWANIFIIVPSLIYFIYNIQVTSDPSQYGSNYLYVQGDLLFTIGGIFYFFAGLRDDGWAWWLPTGGVWAWDTHALIQARMEDPEFAAAAAKRSLLVYILNDWFGIGLPACCSGRRGAGEGKKELGHERAPPYTASSGGSPTNLQLAAV